MCPESYRFLRNGSVNLLINETTAAPNVVRTVRPNPERVGFVLATGGAIINYRPSEFGVAVNAGTFNPWGGLVPPLITIWQYGLLITAAWDFAFPTAGNTYQVWEFVTPKDWK